MENFRFILEPYNRHQRNRYTCPSCGKHREFTRYIDTQGAISFPEYVGKCNRINNCGYHYTPATNKIEVASVHVSKSTFVDAPVIEEYPLTLECKVISMEERFGEMYVVGEVLNMQADESILDDMGRVDFDKLKPLSFDSSARTYRVLGETVGTAFKDGEKLL